MMINLSFLFEMIQWYPTYYVSKSLGRLKYCVQNFKTGLDKTNKKYKDNIILIFPYCISNLTYVQQLDLWLDFLLVLLIHGGHKHVDGEGHQDADETPQHHEEDSSDHSLLLMNICFMIIFEGSINGLLGFVSILSKLSPSFGNFFANIILRHFWFRIVWVGMFSYLWMFDVEWTEYLGIFHGFEFDRFIFQFFHRFGIITKLWFLELSWI